MKTDELIFDDNETNNKYLSYLNERLGYSGIYIAINEDSNEGYVGMTENDLKKRIKSQISKSHDPKVNKLFNMANTRVHIVTVEPINFEYADLYLYKDITYSEYCARYKSSRIYPNTLKKIEYELYRFVQSKGYKMLNKEIGFSPDAKNNYEHGYSEEFINLYENSLKKDNFFDPKVKNFLFPCNEDEKFMNLKMQHIDLQIEFNTTKNRVIELEMIEKDLNNQLNEVHLLIDYMQTTGNTLEKINDMRNNYDNICKENYVLRTKIKEIRAILNKQIL